MTGDVFGAKNSASNYGMINTSKGLAAVIGGMAQRRLLLFSPARSLFPFTLQQDLTCLQQCSCSS